MDEGVDLMSGKALHPEVIRARLRMKFGTLANFEAQRGLPERSVTDVLRGRSIRRTEKAIAKELGVDLHQISSRYADFASANVDSSRTRKSAHRLNAEAC